MADTKISALTAASTPLDGTELVPIVQGGSTKKATAADLGITLQDAVFAAQVYG